MTLFNGSIRDGWAGLMALRSAILSPAAARDQREENAAAEETEERSDPKVASACHQLGLVAQALEHPEAARGWHIEALKAAAELNDSRLCAKSAHQLAELCQDLGRPEEAAAWSVLSLANMAVAPGRPEPRSLPDRQALARRVDLGTVKSVWRGATGGHLPARLQDILESWLENVPEQRQGAVGTGSAPDPEWVPAQQA